MEILATHETTGWVSIALGLLLVLYCVVMLGCVVGIVKEAREIGRMRR